MHNGTGSTSGGVITGLLNHVPLKNVKIYPNPNQGSFSIELPEISGTMTIQIFNLSGLTILKNDFSGYSQKIAFD